MHDSNEYGILRWPLKELVRASGVPMKHARELIETGVLKGADRDAAPFVFRPRHSGQDGEPVVLAECGDGPLWYSSRMVRDEYVRQRRGASTRFDSENQPREPSPDKELCRPPMPPFGGRQGDGPSSSSSSSEDRYVADAPSPASPASGRSSKIPSCPYEEIQRAYNETLPELSEVRMLGEGRKRAIKKFWQWVLTSKRSDGTPRAQDAASAMTWVREYFKRASKNDFLMGRAGSNWRADLDFLVTERGLAHVIEKTQVSE